ncbi:flagellar motor protein MotB [Crenobacter sp. SG2305]|uniref:flagellar motor protein MotB n=1 Tax=Crenobacter oryzisoli TaxID=3056844 RepID=UPI0025AACBBF|nr:flagellar motor protein MotB [Crenobacter sp. SG2305]MDN0083115.1 flagellar motor protein MotB [Crenobacter sp. SG2305]
MADESQRPIIVKRIKKGGHAHHGGAWKLAYADFVTAMMAFFLLMWLLGSVSEGTLKGIAEYFKMPIKVALMGGNSAGQSTSVLKGGGTDLSRKAGQVRRSPFEEQEREKVRLKELEQNLQHKIASNPLLKDYKDQVKLEMTPEGLRIQIIDEKNRPMFDSGSYRLLPQTKEILAILAKDLAQVSNHLSISGHTDARPYSGGSSGYSNWELSADRANAARRELLASGVPADQVLRVVGLAAANPLNTQNVFSAENRRITIMVLNKETEQRILAAGVPVSPSGEVSAGQVTTATDAAVAAAAKPTTH